MPKLAIFGGTFNPMHWGHLLMAEMALDQLSLDQIIWVPTPYPPHRASTPLVDIHHRLAMVERAIAPHSGFTLSTVDLNRTGTSYAIDTLSDLQALYPDSEWYWVLGLDAFQTLPRWYRRQELAAQCCWLVAPRLGGATNRSLGTENGGIDENKGVQTMPDGLTVFDPVSLSRHLCEQVVQQMAQEVKLHWQLLQMPLVGISASLIRQYCGDRRSIRYLVPDVVHAYITAHKLYSCSHNG